MPCGPYLQKDFQHPLKRFLQIGDNRPCIFWQCYMWVKICGITDEETAPSGCSFYPDAIGLNFHSPSRRSVSKNRARRIADLVPCGISRVGVFVNHAASEIEDLVHHCRLDQIQLHGDESPEDVAEVWQRLPAIPLIRAWRIGGESLADLHQHLIQCRRHEVPLVACLIDSYVPGEYGGTGHPVSWDLVSQGYRHDIWPPLILAGGLNTGNVREAIRTTRPWGVDVASGVESAAGIKDLELVRNFIAHARQSSSD